MVLHIRQKCPPAATFLFSPISNFAIFERKRGASNYRFKFFPKDHNVRFLRSGSSSFRFAPNTLFTLSGTSIVSIPDVFASIGWSPIVKNANRVACVPPATKLLSVLSTVVGVCVLIGSLLYKLPQVIRVLKNKSAKGISVLMYALETLGTTFSALYFTRRQFPFSTYGETVFIMFQNVALLAMIVYYQRLPRTPAFVLAALYFIMMAALLSQLVPLSLLVFLQLCSIPILNLARVPQIVLNYNRKATGELSPITLGLQLLGNIARIFTTLTQVGDPLMFASICVATCFNAVLFAQWIYYSNRLKSPKAS